VSGNFKHRLTIDPDLSPFLGLLHHYFQNSNNRLSKAKAIKRGELWYILYAYDLFERDLIERYAGRKLLNSDQYSTELTRQDVRDYRSVDIFQENNFHDVQRYLPGFHFLLFFDLYTAFRYYFDLEKQDFNKEELEEQNLKKKKLLALRNMSRFVLKILPLLVGPYGFGQRGSELKDAAFYYLDKTNYQLTEAAIKKGSPSPEWLSEIEQAMERIRQGFPHKFVLGRRRKGIHSAFQKSRTYNKRVEDLWDLYGYRVIIDSLNPKSCKAFLEEITKWFNVWQDEEKGISNYVEHPKENGYQSIHVVLENAYGDLVEIQIRTTLMNSVAHLGDPAHEVYKKEVIPGMSSQQPTRIARVGRMLLEQELEAHHLSINDFVQSLDMSLEHIPISHYYEHIADGEYDLDALIKGIQQTPRIQGRALVEEQIEPFDISLSEFEKRYLQMNKLTELPPSFYEDFMQGLSPDYS